MSRRNALAGVLRVRAVRERDSRLGLAQALREQQEAEQSATDQQEQLRILAPFRRGSAAAFLAHAGRVDAHRRAASEAAAQVAVARGVSEAARAHWQDDKTRLRAVEMLDERRAEAHRLELARRSATELDDLAGQRWSRQSGGAS